MDVKRSYNVIKLLLEKISIIIFNINIKIYYEQTYLYAIFQIIYKEFMKNIFILFHYINEYL